MKSSQLRKHHLLSFAKLSITEKLFWAFNQARFLVNFKDAKAKKLNKKLRRNGKKYFNG